MSKKSILSMYYPKVASPAPMPPILETSDTGHLYTDHVVVTGLPREAKLQNICMVLQNSFENAPHLAFEFGEVALHQDVGKKGLSLKTDQPVSVNEFVDAILNAVETELGRLDIDLSDQNIKLMPQKIVTPASITGTAPRTLM